MTLPQYDVIVVGAGHNGLVCASLLAKAGLSTLVLEKHSQVGGACVTEELLKNCKVSTAASWYGMLRPQIIAELGLYELGLDPLHMDPQMVSLFRDGRKLRVWQNVNQTCDELSAFPGITSRDVSGYRSFCEFSDQIREIVCSLMLEHSVASGTFQQALRHRNLEAYSSLIASGSVCDVLDQFLENDELKALLAAPALAIANASPRAKGSGFCMFYMMAAQTRDVPGVWGLARGGMGSVTAAIQASAERSGAMIQVSSPVEQIVLDNGRAVGVELKDGSQLRSKCVVSNADPKTTFLRLLPLGVLSEKFANTVRQLNSHGSGTMFHARLRGLPPLVGSTAQAVNPDDYRGAFLIAPTTDYLDKAWRDSSLGRPSPEPIITMSIPSAVDESLTAGGEHLLSAFVQFTPYQLRGSSWEDEKDRYHCQIIDVLELYFPTIRKLIIESSMLTPVDLEKRFGMTGGHPEHVQMDFSHFFDDLVVPLCKGCESPIPQLYLCGAGVHPGGTVTGAGGYNAAHHIISLNSRN